MTVAVERSVSKKPRIRNGICGSGDKMSSALIEGLRLPKSHKVFQIYGAQERVCNTLSLFEKRYGQYLESEDQRIIKWLIRNLNCLGGFCYTRGNDDNFVFPESFLEKIEERIMDVFQPATGDCMDFLIHETESFIHLDRARIETRDLERAFAIWYEVLYGKQDPSGSVLLMSKVLNRLSTYFFNLIRYESFKRGIGENTWAGKVESF
jgi:cob(I)alamin adenosyltransferase